MLAVLKRNIEQSAQAPPADGLRGNALLARLTWGLSSRPQVKMISPPAAMS